MDAITAALEQALQDAFVRGEFDRLQAFACRCAAQTLEPDTPPPWRDALSLAHRRALRQLGPADYARELRAIKPRLPIAASAIGLMHGIPSAATLLAIVAALDPGPLSAALGASSHQRLHARLKAQERDGGSCALAEPLRVDPERARLLTRPAGPPTVGETCVARWQLAVWNATGPARNARAPMAGRRGSQ